MRRAWWTTSLAIAVTLLVGLFAPTINPAQAQIMGPRLDVIIYSEEPDRSKALTEIISGTQDTLMFPISGDADLERARSSQAIHRSNSFGAFDTLLMNPARQLDPHPSNPFSFKGVRQGMHHLIDREFIVREVFSGNAAAMGATHWHPREAEYGRNIAGLLPLEEKWSYDPRKGRTLIFETLTAAGWIVGAEGFWHDANGRLVEIKGLIRTQDERLQMGRYYAALLRGLNFFVTENAGPGVASVAFGGPPDEDLWHFYTGTWGIVTRAWVDNAVYFWSCPGFEPFCVRQIEDDPTADPGNSTLGRLHVVDADLVDISERLLTGNYSSLEERAELIIRGTELIAEDPMRIFVETRLGVFAFNNRFRTPTLNLFSGPVNPFALKTATVPSDVGGLYDGLRVGRVRIVQMFGDLWNYWGLSTRSFADTLQRDAMLDRGMNPHPHTGRWMDNRMEASVQTGGPDGTLVVPTDAMVFETGKDGDTSNDAWAPVGNDVTATSKVTVRMHFGSWHHGPAITMDDVLYGYSNLWRRQDGDLAQIPGLNDLFSIPESFLLTSVLKGIRVVDSTTLEVYVDVWHVDEGQIAAAATTFPAPEFPSTPWEVGEIAMETLLRQETASSQSDATGTGRVGLDLTKGASLGHLEAAMNALRALSHRPPGVGTGGWDITPSEAQERWERLGAWYSTYGHFWPSNGPFYLDKVDQPNRQTIMRANRDYLRVEDFWDALTVPAIPSVRFAPPAPVVFSGTPGIFDYTVSVGTRPTEDLATNIYFLRDLDAGEFLISEGTPTRIGAGTYRIDLPSAITEQLLIGNFELISVVTHNQAAAPTITRIPFLILPSVDFFSALVDARVGLVEADVDALSAQLSDIESSASAIAGASSGLTTLAVAVALLGTAAILVAVASLVALLRQRGRGG